MPARSPGEPARGTAIGQDRLACGRVGGADYRAAGVDGRLRPGVPASSLRRPARPPRRQRSTAAAGAAELEDRRAVPGGGRPAHVHRRACSTRQGGDLILTAAHCVAEGIDTTFVAGFYDAADPADIWKVDAIYLDPRWVTNQDPLADFAILRVARDGGGHARSRGRRWARRSAPRPKPGTARQRHRIRAGRRRRSDRLPGGHGAGAGWLPVAAVRRADRRHQRRTVDHRADHHRSDRRARRRRMRRKRLVFTAIRRRGRRAADARRGRRSRRRGACRVR